MEDPFAVLGLRSDATGSAVRSAYRRLAKRLHPDVPGTGDAAAYMRVRRAYDEARRPRAAAPAMADPATGRGAGPGAGPGAKQAEDLGPEHVGAWAVRHAARDNGWEAALAPEPGPLPRFRRAGLRPVAVALAAAIVVAGGVRLWHRPPAPEFSVVAAPDAAPPPAREPEAADAVAGGGSFYVRPGAAPATVFRYDAPSHRYAPDGRMEAFAPVRVGKMVPDSGMAELAGPEGGRPHYVLAEALASGDERAALTSRCVYQAGTPPEPGEFLASRPLPAGPWRAVPVDNTGDLSAVFSLRDAEGQPVVSVFLGPHGSALLPLAPGFYRAEYASGDLWSRACARFVAGARAARMIAAQPLPARYVLPIPGAADLPDGGLSEPVAP